MNNLRKDEDIMLIVQNKFSTKIVFNFTDVVLKYSIKDSSGSSSYNFTYEDIDIKNENEMSIRNSWFRNVGIIWMGIGLVQLIIRYSESSKFIIPFWLLLGIILTAVYYINTKKYKVYPAENGNILILKNKDQHIIIDEIKNRRNKKLKERYFEINFSNSIDQEVAKYKWLEDEKIITEKEFKEKVTELKVKYINSNFSVN